MKPLTTDIPAADSALVPIHPSKRQGVERLFPSFVGRHLGTSDGSGLRGDARCGICDSLVTGGHKVRQAWTRLETCSASPVVSVIANPCQSPLSFLLQSTAWPVSRLKKGTTALPFSRVEPCFNGVDHHCGECDFLIEGVLANARGEEQPSPAQDGCLASISCCMRE